MTLRKYKDYIYIYVRLYINSENILVFSIMLNKLRSLHTMYFLLGLLVLLLIGYYYLKKELDYWKIRGVPYEQGKIFLGNLGETLSTKKSVSDVYEDIYKKFKKYRYCGMFQFRQPELLIFDPDVIKDVLTTKFNNFHDNWLPINEVKDPILAKNPFFAKGEEWKILRGKLTPQFTASKMKYMFPLIKEVGHKLLKYLNDNHGTFPEDGVNAKDLSNKFAADNVASCGFGIDARSFVDTNPEFIELGGRVFLSNTLAGIIRLASFIFPELGKLLVPRIMDTSVVTRFREIVLDNLKYREINGVKRGDFLDALLDIKNTTKTFDYNIDYMLAHAMSFYLDGYETSATGLHYVFYELGANLDVQEKLRREINDVLKEDDDNFTYDSLQQMKYLEMVLQETLRRYPPLTTVSRRCTATTIIDSAAVGGQPLVVEKGTIVSVPVMSIHYDPQYYPNPEKFDPERFSQESVDLRPKSVYIPFGDGPRMCLGRRFAILQIKVAIVSTLRQFEIHVNKKTQTPLQFDPQAFILTAIGGIWLNFSKLPKLKN